MSYKGTKDHGDYEDYITHHNDFLKACEIARDNAEDQYDEDYWQHQINVLNKLAAKFV